MAPGARASHLRDLVTDADVVFLIGGGEDLTLVDAVHAQGLKDTGFHKMPDAGFCHDRNGHGFHNFEN